MQLIPNHSNFLHPIADLHCDLLCYLSRSPQHHPHDITARCSIPQLKAGNVKIQTMAIFTETKIGSSKNGFNQTKAYRSLIKKYPDIFERVDHPEQFDQLNTSDKICLLAAIENASSFCEENETMDEVLINLQKFQRTLGKVAYISLTWNMENRFGGGASTKIGLKSDGKELIRYMARHNIPLDLSHASDYLAFDIFNYLEKASINIPVLASHSNLRKIVAVPRNLSDELAKEIFRRKGIVGINFFRPFLGSDSHLNFIKLIEHFFDLQGESRICFGADFFHDEDLSPQYRIPTEAAFFTSFDNAGTYPNVVDLWRKHLKLSEETISQVCYKNFINFYHPILFG